MSLFPRKGDFKLETESIMRLLVLFSFQVQIHLHFIFNGRLLKVTTNCL